MNSLLSFKGKIIASVILLLTISLAISAVISNNQMSASMVSSIDKYSKLNVSTTADRITTWFSTMKTGLKKSAPDFAIRHDDNETLRMVKQIEFATQANDVVASYEDGSLYSALHGKVDIDARELAWYKDAKIQRKTVVTNIYKHSTTGELLISIAEPFFSDGQFSGVLLADIKLDVLQGMVEISVLEDSVTTLYNEDTMAIATTDPLEIVGQRAPNRNKEYTELKTHIENNDQGMIELDDYGFAKIVYFSTLVLDDNTVWKIIITLDKKSHLAAVNESSQVLLISGIVLVLLSSLVIYVSLSRLYAPILALKDMINDLARGDGDLTQRLDVTRNDDLGEIAEAVNRFIINLQEMMLKIANSTVHISTGIGELRNQTEQNNQVLTEHANETEQVVVAITEMSSTADSVAQSAARSASFTQQTTEQANQSKVVVDTAVSGVADLVNEVESMATNIQTMNNDTKKISAVLGIIGGIADQTNLLALNAAIEAARAGEQGRGFAVVADEVRTLAARTQQSTSEINEMLTNLNRGTDSVVSAMDATRTSCEQTANTTASVNESLDCMTNSIVQINDLGIQIATAAEEQSSVTEEINRNMTAIRTMVTQLTQNGNKTMDSTHDLSNCNDELTQIISQFKLE